MNSINPIGINNSYPNFKSKITITSPNVISAYEKSTLKIPVKDFINAQKKEIQNEKKLISEACKTLFDYIGNLGSKIIINK